MIWRKFRSAATLLIGLLLFLPGPAAAGDKILRGVKTRPEPGSQSNIVRHRCLTPSIQPEQSLSLDRRNAWSLPRAALAPDFDTTIHCLVLRFNFQYEDPDDLSTTGRGHMDLSPHPIPNEYNSATPQDSILYLERVGHFIDPPPHDSFYFDRHMKALNAYWETVSEGRIHLTWDIFPPASDSIYELPQAMSYYGRCDFNQVVEGLEHYFEDCIKLVDTVHLVDPLHPNIDFSQYQSIFLFHAGSDGQNDMGYPPTCRDLFTGFIRFGVPIPVDDGAAFARTALMMPETAVQDGRSTALNAVMAHEFGHQLGLVDLYRTDYFITQLGDFALMDNNGFGAAVDFGWPAGSVHGSIPVYPSAWSRAHLGIIPVVDFREGSDIRLVAAEVASQGMKLARVPVSETEYYLIENRNEDIDGVEAGLQFDTLTNVILWPARAELDSAGSTVFVKTGEYDFLLPGSGMLIFHVEEAVAALDYDGDGVNNFADNHLQLDKLRRFVHLVEADGLPFDFGGDYRIGFGSSDDMYRDDRNASLTPNTNPPAEDNSGNNTRIYITGITRAVDTTLPKQPFMDSVMLFDVEVDRMVEGFPVRGGQPQLGLSPIADDLDGDGTDEIIVVSDNLLTVFTSSGEDFLQLVDPCGTCSTYYDTMITSINRRTSLEPAKGYPVPLYVKAPDVITAGPVTGGFGVSGAGSYVAIGYPIGGGGNVVIYDAVDANDDGQADFTGVPITTTGFPINLTFGDFLSVLSLDTLSGNAYLYRQYALFEQPAAPLVFSADEYYGMSRVGAYMVLLSGSQEDSQWSTTFHFISDTAFPYTIDGRFALGPITVDVNRDGTPEVVAFSRDGDGVYVSIDATNSEAPFRILSAVSTEYEFTTEPTAGDIDLDGYPEILLGGQNRIYAFDASLILKINFPLEVDDKHRDSDVISRAVITDIRGGGVPEMAFASNARHIYAYGEELTFGFPLNSGEQAAPKSNSSPVVFRDSTGGKFGYLGGDGWFYAWEVDADTVSNFWPMATASPDGSNQLDQSLLPAPSPLAETFPEDRFFTYPNPVVDGHTTIRYYLGSEARRVEFMIYDLSGQRVASLEGTTRGGVDNERVWDCSDVTPGVYRCVIEIEFNNETRNAFTDIAVIR